MTRQQKNIVIGLALVNVVIFCCLVPAILFSSGPGGSRVAAQPTGTRTRTQTPTPTDTATPTLTPLATSTFVINSPPTSAIPTVTPRSLEAGWKFYDASPEGFAIALPSTWQKVNLDPTALASYIQALKDKNPKFASTFANVGNQLVASQIKFYALDVSQDAIAANYLTSMNVLREPLPSATTLDTYVQANLANLTKSGLANKPPTRKRLTLPAGAAEEFKYQSTTAVSSDSKATASLLQYLLVRGTYGIVITFGTSPDKDKTYAPVFQKMIQSLQWVP